MHRGDGRERGVSEAASATATGEGPRGRNITLSWLLRLRWGAVAGQTLTVAASALVLGLALPVGPLLATIGVTVLTNLALARWLSRPAPEAPPQLIASVLVLDTLLLTILLLLTGGPANPFGALYLVHVTLAAVTLGARWGWAVMALSSACFLLLFAVHVPLEGLERTDASAWGLHLAGTWVAYVVAATVTAYFVSRIASELQRRDGALAEAQARVARTEKLASLTTLAAGAAHELGTPLGTIAVVARELERSAERLSLGPSVTEDLRLIREQVERCRLILVQMSAKAGEAMGETPGPLEIAALVAEVRTGLGAERAGRLDVAVAAGLERVLAPRQALAHVLTSLARNAFDASGPGGRVSLEVVAHEEGVRFAVRDEGHGMPPEVLSRAGDPFFTTKPAGRGTGLGVFLARAFAEQLGGRLVLVSEVSKGTIASLELPRNALERSVT
jgi:two-component system sensor histidine kinase RegB